MRFIAALALALGLSFPAFAGGDFDNGYNTKRVSGKTSDFSAASSAANGTTTSTYDAFNFGFESRYVRLCIRAQGGAGAVIYARLATTVTNETSVLKADTRRQTAPTSTSAAFITGVTGVLAERAVPFSGPASTANHNPAPSCYTMPWVTRGVVLHLASGIATVDTHAYGQ